MRLGPFAIHLGPSMWPGYGWHWLDGRRFPPLMTTVAPTRASFGRGMVLSVLGRMVWITRDEREVRL